MLKPHPMLKGLDLVLASGSARRKAIMDKLGLPFKIIPPNIEENRVSGLSPQEQALQFALDKGEEVYGRITGHSVLAADTLVILDDCIMGKPSCPEEAAGMIRSLSGRTHRVVTGVALYDQRLDEPLSDYDLTEVEFRKLCREEIQWYVDTGEPLDKAGGYGIQGYGAVFVKRIAGCYYNVMGLPVNIMISMLQGLSPKFTI